MIKQNTIHCISSEKWPKKKFVRSGIGADDEACKFGWEHCQIAVVQCTECEIYQGQNWNKSNIQLYATAKYCLTSIEFNSTAFHTKFAIWKHDAPKVPLE